MPEEKQPIELKVKEMTELISDSRYELLKQIDSGGTGTIYKGVQLSTQRPVALKLINDDETMASPVRFDQEAKALSSLAHPNIVSVIDFGYNNEKKPYLVLEFVEGKNLDEIMEAAGGRLSNEQFYIIFSQICRGLAHAHARGIVHRDLKPANIMIVDEPNGERIVKIIDFGFAKSMQQEPTASQSGFIVGSPAYMSPEQALGEKIDRRSDIYSLGCMMYEAVSGKPPFDAENAFVSITKRLTEDPEPLPDDCVDDKLRQIIMQALKRDKEHRQQSVERVLNQLDLRRAGRSLQEARSQREINQNQTTEPKQESQPIEGAGPEQVENSNQGERRPKVSPKASSGWQPWKQPSLRRSFGAQSSPLELSLPRLSAGSLIVLASIGFFLAFTRTNMVDRYAGQTPQQLLVLGDQNRDDKKYAESENVLKAALDKVDSQAPKDLSMRANIEWRLGVTDFLQGKGADAERVLKNAETDARASGNKLALAHTLNWQGLLQMQRGNHEAAAQLFHDSGNMFLDTSGRNAITAERFVFEANEWLQVHQTKPAREALIQAREIYQSAGEPGRAEGLTTRISALDSPLETSN